MKSGPGTYSCFCNPGWKGSGFQCSPTVNSTDEEQQRRIIAGSKAIIDKVRQIRAEEDRRLRQETDQEHAERIAEVEKRISALLKQKERNEKQADNQVGNLEQRVENVAKTTELINQQKQQQLELINSLKGVAAKQSAAMLASLDVNNNKLLAENAADLAASSNSIGALPPVDKKATTTSLADGGLVHPTLVPPHTLKTLPIIVEEAEADVVPVIARAIVSEMPVMHVIQEVHVAPPVVAVKETPVVVTPVGEGAGATPVRENVVVKETISR